MIITPTKSSDKISKSVGKTQSHRIQLRSRDWLNIVIISVSAMFLLLVLIGKMMTESESRSSQQTQVRPTQLLRIDFGALQLVKKDEGWTEKNALLTSTRAQLIGRNWQDLLRQPSKKTNNTQHSGETLLLYFSNIEQPVVVKLTLSSKTAKAVFVAAKVEYSIKRDAIEQYLPNQLKALTQE